MNFGILQNIRSLAYPGCVLLLLAGGCAQSPAEEPLQKKVYIAETDTGYQLIKDGQPFFVKGACVGDAYWAEFKAAGGNTVRIYDPTNLKEKLDRADSLGLMVQAIKDTGGLSGDIKADRTKVKDALAAVKNFPGITGAMTFTAEGDPKKCAVVVKINDEGQFAFHKSVCPK